MSPVAVSEEGSTVHEREKERCGTEAQMGSLYGHDSDVMTPAIQLCHSQYHPDYHAAVPKRVSKQLRGFT